MSIFDHMESAIHRAVVLRVEEITIEETKKAQEAIAIRINKEVDLLALNVMTNYSVQHNGDVMTIRVTKPAIDR